MNFDCINGVAYVKIKHNLHNRPEPCAITEEVKNYIVQNSDKRVPDLYNSIKSEWKRLQKKEIIYPNAYLTDVDRWICSCKYFLTSRFMICKHLIHLKGSVYKNYFKKVCDLII